MIAPSVLTYDHDVILLIEVVVQSYRVAYQYGLKANDYTEAMMI